MEFGVYNFSSKFAGFKVSISNVLGFWFSVCFSGFSVDKSERERGEGRRREATKIHCGGENRLDAQNARNVTGCDASLLNSMRLYQENNGCGTPAVWKNCIKQLSSPQTWLHSVALVECQLQIAHNHVRECN